MTFVSGPVSDTNPHPVAASGFTAIVTGSVQRPADAAPYAVGDIVAQSTVAASCSGVSIAAARANDLTGCIRRCRVKINDAVWPNATINVHVFKDAPTFWAGDNAAFTGNLSESNYIGALSVTLDRLFASSTVKGIGVPLSGSELLFDPSTGTQNLFFVIETRNAVTPGSAKTFTVSFEVMRD